MKTLRSSPYRYFLYMLLLAGVLSGARWLWNGALFPVDHSYLADRGVIDLRGHDLDGTKPLALDGQWEFYPGRLLDGEQLQAEPYEARDIRVPGKWDAAFDKESGSYGYGTYRLRVLLDPLAQPIAFRFKGIQASSEVEINGETLGGSGKVAATASEYKPGNGSYKVAYSVKGTTEIELIVRAANFDSPFSGGMLRSVRFGSEAVVDGRIDYSAGFQLAILLVMLLHGLYACIVYLYRPKDRSLFVTGLIYLSVGIAVGSGYDKMLFHWLPANYTWTLKIRTVVLLWQNVFIVAVYRNFVGSSLRKTGFRAYVVLLTIMSAVIVVSPVSVVNGIVDRYVFLAFYAASYVWIIWTACRLALRKTPDRDLALLLLTVAGIETNLAWSTVETMFTDNSSVYYPIDLVVTVMIFSAYWFKKYIRNAEDVRHLYEQLKAADRMKDRFLANTSHELRTPLHGIMNMTSSVLARENDKLDERSRKEMELVGTVSRRMSRLLDDLLDLARLREYRIILRREPLSIQAIVPGVTAMLRHMTEGRPVELETNIPEALPPVLADEKRFVQILYNLLHNALKYTEEGRIVISAEALDGSVEIRVADTGVGMDAETMARIFSPYVQGAYGEQDGRGIGLGLSIGKQLVELHGGELAVESEPGRGTTFRFRLPLAVAPLRSAPLEESLAGPEAAATIEAYADVRRENGVGNDEVGGRLHNALPDVSQDVPIRLLAVDDDPINLEVLAGILSAEPYLVTTASSGRKALDLLETENWDLLIVDVMMPSMSGYELTRRVRERYAVSELPILLLTARGQPADVYTGFLAGANDYVTKPADAVELRCRIRSLIALKQSIQERLRIEAAYLQAQIEPHFLFNTLNSLMVLSEVDTERMRKLGEAFATYLRVSFDYLNTGERVDIAHELELVQAYLHIEHARFQDKLHIVWEVDPDVRALLPPLSIQPLVENAVKHGLMGRATGGTLRIGIARRSRDILVTVRDNGVGISADKAAELPARGGNKRGGIGLSNTDRRLKKLYGQGLTIESALGEGTTVSFVIPLQSGRLNEDAGE